MRHACWNGLDGMLAKSRQQSHFPILVAIFPSVKRILPEPPPGRQSTTRWVIAAVAAMPFDDFGKS